MAVSYQQQPNYQQHPQAYPPPPAPTTPAKAMRWPWILGIIVAFAAGIGIGTAGNTGGGATSARETVTVRVPAPAGETPAETAAAEKPPAKPAGPATTMGNGVYQVGVDVQAGQYKTAGPPADAVIPMCYWARNKDDSGEFEALIPNGTVEGPGSVTVNAGEFVELSGDCTWTRTG